MPPFSHIQTRFEQALRDQTLVLPGQTVLVGVSGGPDSVALLHLFAAIAREPEWRLSLEVVHLNHQLRGQAADEDAEFVEALCRELKIPCVVESVDVAKRAASENVSIEQAARACRFELFERVCLKRDLKVVALGHHADDQAETVLHRIVRGTGLRGLGGIRSVRPLRQDSEITLIRPLLGFKREEIRSYLAQRGLSFCEDATNRSEAYTRNRIRHEILPFLQEKLNPQVSDALIRLADQARGVDAYLVETGQRVLESLIVEEDDRQLVLHCSPLVRKARVIQTELIRRAILRMGFPEGELSYAHLNSVADLAAGTEGTKMLHLPGGLRVSRRYSHLVFGRASGGPIRHDASAPIRVTVGERTALPGFGVELNIEEMSVDGKMIADHLAAGLERKGPADEEWVDADAAHPPLIARSRHPGDRFFPLGMTGLKKLSDFLIDEKIDAPRRERVVLLCDQLGPIWVVGLRIDERVRLTRLTRRVLRLRVSRTREEL